MDHQNIIKNKSVLSMNIECRGFDWSNGEVIRSELIKFNDSNITWRVMLYPKLTQGNKLPDSSQEPKKHHTLIKIQIEDKTDEILDYICHFKCEGDLAIKWSSKQTNLNHKCMYNSTEKAVKFLQRKREVPTDDWEQIKRFKITAQIIVLPHYYSIKPIANTVSWPNLRDKIKFYEKKFDANNEIEMSSIFIEPFAPISVSSPAFMASIKKLRTTLK